MKNATIHLAIFLTLFLPSAMILGSEQDAAVVPAQDDAAIVAALDNQFQAAAKTNDFATMDRILADDFVLVIGTGQVFHKADLISRAKMGNRKYEHQEEIDNSQRVRVWGDTAVVTAKLWSKGAFDGHASEVKLWFSDVYVRTRSGWKYVFGQSSIPLPNDQ